MSAVANCNKSLSIEARIRRHSRFEKVYGAALWFKAQLDFKKRQVSGYMAGYIPVDDPDHRRAGYAYIARFDQFDMDDRGSQGAALICDSFDLDPPPIVHDNGYNDIRIETNGSSHTYYLNGRQICTGDDATYSSGAIIADGGSFQAETRRGSFFDVDSVSVHSIDTAPVSEQLVPVMDLAEFMPRSRPNRHHLGRIVSGGGR
jgi:hypothetical protein